MIKTNGGLWGMVLKLSSMGQTGSWRRWLIGLVVLAVASCTPLNTVAEVTVPGDATTATEMVASPTPAATPTPPATPTPATTVDTQPTRAPTVTATPTPGPTRAPTVAPLSPRLITAEPLFVGGDLQFVEWSPDGRYLAYFEYTEAQVATSPVEGLRGAYPGAFVFYDTRTGEKCTDYPLSGLFSYEGAGSGAQWRWLPDGRLLIRLPDGQLLLTATPCVAGENIAAQFGEPIASLGAFSPDERWLVLTGARYWLYDLATGNAHPVVDVQPDDFNNLVWSPDGRYISITLAGNYTGDRSPVGGTRVIEVATGATVARHAWEPANALDGTFGGPVWISHDTFVVTLSLDQGPFFMNVNGDVRPVLPLFDESFVRENYWPPLDVFAEVADGRYAILRGNEGRDSAAKLYTFTPEGESVEILEQALLTFRIFPTGEVGYEAGGRYWTRPVFEVGAPLLEQPPGANPWLPSDNQLLLTANSTGIISVYDPSSEKIIDRLQVAGYESGYHLHPILSPGGQWLAIFVQERRYSLGRALFVVPAPAP